MGDDAKDSWSLRSGRGHKWPPSNSEGWDLSAPSIWTPGFLDEGRFYFSNVLVYGHLWRSQKDTVHPHI